jgi:hypothetical protein
MRGNGRASRLVSRAPRIQRFDRPEGRLTLASQPGVGTTVTLILPRTIKTAPDKGTAV